MVKTILKKFDRRGNPLPPARMPNHPLVSLPKSAHPKTCLLSDQPFETTTDTAEEIHTIPLSLEMYPTSGPQACTVTPRRVDFSTAIRVKEITLFKRGKCAPIGTVDGAARATLQGKQALCHRLGWRQRVVQPEGFDWVHSARWTNPKYGNMELGTQELAKMIAKHEKCERAHFQPKLVAPTAMDGSDRVAWTRSDFPGLDFETDTLVHMLEKERYSPGMFSRLVKFVEAGFTKVVTVLDDIKTGTTTADWLHVDCHVAFDPQRVERMLQENQFDPKRQAFRMQMQLACLRAGWEEGQYMERCSDGLMRYVWRHPLFKDEFGVGALYDILTDRVPFPSLTRK